MAKTMNEKRFLELALYCPFCGSKDLNVEDRKTFNELVKKHGGACITVRCNNCHCQAYHFTSYEEDKEKEAKNYGKRLEKLLTIWNTRAGVPDEQ
jgi:hypothetical protein